jgi:hypothetical protein
VPRKVAYGVGWRPVMHIRKTIWRGIVRSKVKVRKLRNVTTGEVVEVRFQLAPGVPESKALREMLLWLNEEHRSGTQHVRECHGGEAQVYEVLPLC